MKISISWGKTKWNFYLSRNCKFQETAECRQKTTATSTFSVTSASTTTAASPSKRRRRNVATSKTSRWGSNGLWRNGRMRWETKDRQMRLLRPFASDKHYDCWGKRPEKVFATNWNDIWKSVCIWLESIDQQKGSDRSEPVLELTFSTVVDCL